MIHRAAGLFVLFALLACSSELARGQHTASPKAIAAAQPPAAEQPAPEVPQPAAPTTPDAPASPAPVEPGEPQLVVPISIEDPTGHALTAFHAALARTQQGEQVRIVVYGASHTASDMFTGLLRRRLQERFGEAGPGFVMPAKPWRWYRHDGIELDRSRGFEATRVRAHKPKYGQYGLLGVALDAPTDRWSRAGFRTHSHNELSGQASRFELHYLAQPKGGRMSIFLDGKRVRVVSTRADEAHPAYTLIEAEEDGHHHFELRTHADGPVKVFGVAVESTNPGVVLDTLGIPGARAETQLYWEETTQRDALARRNPALVMLAYGTNEAGDDDDPIENYERKLRKALTRIRETVPNASCVLIGPSDRPLENDDETYAPRPRTAQIVETQRRVAPDFGCGFFDVVALMGGEMSMTRWVAAPEPLGTPDHVHFTRRGYEAMGNVLHDALLAGYSDAASTPSAPAEPATKEGGPLASK